MKNRLKLPNKTAVLDENGPLCPRCKRPMEVRVHKRITPRMLRQPYYYSRWHNCYYRDCKTTIVHLDKFKVYPIERLKTTREEHKIKSWLDELAPEEQERLIAVQNQLKPPWED